MTQTHRNLPRLTSDKRVRQFIAGSISPRYLPVMFMTTMVCCPSSRSFCAYFISSLRDWAIISKLWALDRSCKSCTSNRAKLQPPNVQPDHQKCTREGERERERERERVAHAHRRERERERERGMHTGIQQKADTTEGEEQRRVRELIYHISVPIYAYRYIEIEKEKTVLEHWEQREFREREPREGVSKQIQKKEKNKIEMTQKQKEGLMNFRCSFPPP